MEKEELVRRIAQILKANLGMAVDPAVLHYIAERVYVDIVEKAVEGERERWVELGLAYYHRPSYH